MAHKRMKPRKHPVSRSTRAQLQFPVSRVERYLRENGYLRLSACTPVFLAGILEYLTASALHLAARVAHRRHKKRISPEHLARALEKSEQLRQVFGDSTKALLDEIIQAKKK
uniref:Histone H2A n=1 Tax=Cavia porcellus TaxID=10141 RepID=H0WAW3_CAVPO